MSRTEWQGKHFKLSHTAEAEGPHRTQTAEHYESRAFITALLCGKGMAFVEGSGFPMEPGDLLVVGTGQLHVCRFEQSGPHERITLYVSPSVSSPLWEYDLDLMQVFSGPPGVGNRYTKNEYNQKAVREILEELCRMTDEQSGRGEDPVKEACAHLLILKLLLFLRDSGQKRDMPLPPHGNDAVIWEICRYIHENLTEALDYQSLQSRFHVGRHHLSVLFRRNTGMTLTEFVLRKRLSRVSELAQQGTPVTLAAEKAGFRNYSHFYKVFKKCYQLSPKQYFAAGGKK